MNVDTFAAIGIVCTALIALSTLVRLAYTKAVRPMWKYITRTVRRTNQVADNLLGDEAKGILSITERMTGVESSLARLAERMAAVEDALERYVRWRSPGPPGRVNPSGQHGPTTRD